MLLKLEESQEKSGIVINHVNELFGVQITNIDDCKEVLVFSSFDIFVPI